MRNTSRAVALAMALVAVSAPAAGPAWSYVDIARSWGTPQRDESGPGSVAHLSLPLGDWLFFAGGAERLDARYEAPHDNVTERFGANSAGIGLHTRVDTAEAFALVSYVDKRRVQHTPAGDSGDHLAGVGFALGARWLPKPWLSVEPQYGLKGYVLDGFTKLDLAARVLPHVWLVGTFDHGPFSGNEYCAGLRWAWADYTYPPSHYPGARVVGSPRSDDSAGLAVGQTLVAVRPLVPQLRPAAGAPELAAIAAGSEIVLQATARNDFGTWWQVAVGEESAWIRETDLKGLPEQP